MVRGLIPHHGNSGYNGKTLLITPRNDEKVNIPKLTLTRAEIELMKLIEPLPNEPYINELSKKLDKSGYSVICDKGLEILVL